MVSLYYIILAFVLAAAAGALIVPKILFISHKKQLFDMPNERKVHNHPVPRLGGLSFYPILLIVTSFIIGLRVLMSESITPGGDPTDTLCKYLFLVVGLTVLYLIGIADDLVGVSYKPKFLAQFGAAVLLVASNTYLNTLNGFLGIGTLPAWLGMTLSVLLVVYITNAINLIDGIDGLASGLCIIALVTLTAINAYHHQYYLALLGACATGAIVPFWFYNVFGNAQRGHKLFMGDTGSLTLGLVLSFLVISMSRNMTSEPDAICHTMAIAFGTLVVPTFDVVRVVVRRLINKKNPFLPDKNHFHHKLLRTGMRSRFVMITILLFSVLFIVINALLTYHLNITWILLIDIVVWISFHVVITMLGNRHKAQLGKEHGGAGQAKG